MQSPGYCVTRFISCLTDDFSRKSTSTDAKRLMKILRVSRMEFLNLRMHIENNVCTRLTNYFSALERVICCLGNKHKNNTQVKAETVHHESTYIILFLTRHTESINDDKNDGLYTSSPCLTRSVFVLLMTLQSITDDVTITRQLWCDHVNSDSLLARYRFYSRRWCRPVV